MWAGASVQIEYFIYGAILMTFGLTFLQVLVIIILGNLSFFLLGLCSLQGPNAGTTVFAINRAGYGPNGSRPISFFNWITQIGFEVEGLLLIVGAGLVLMIKAGFLPGDPAKVILVIAAVLVQGILPFLGHAAIVKTLRWLVLPFVILFAIMLGFAIPHANLHVVKTSGDWQGFTEALAFTIALSGLGWTENGNDYTRYCPTDTSKKGIVGWVFLGTAVPEILIMTLGAVVGTFVLKVGTGAGGFLPFAHQTAIPSWFVVVFLVFAVIQLFGINSLDMYSSGVTLQAIGVPVKRYHAVLIDCAIALGVTMWAIFSGSFTEYLSDFVDIVIVWIAPWCAIFLVDWVLRRYRYVPSELQKTGRDSLYWRSRRHLLAGHHRPGGRHVRRHLRALRQPDLLLPHSTMVERGHGPHPGRLPLRGRLQHLPRPGRRGAGLPDPGHARASASRPTSRTCCSRPRACSDRSSRSPAETPH